MLFNLHFESPGLDVFCVRVFFVGLSGNEAVSHEGAWLALSGNDRGSGAAKMPGM